MGAVELIKWTHEYLKEKGVSDDNMPHFAFRAQQFWDLSPEKIKEVFELGIKSEDILEKVTKAKQIERYFKKINYFYRSLADEN